MSLLSTRLREERRWAGQQRTDVNVTITVDISQFARSFARTLASLDDIRGRGTLTGRTGRAG